MPYGVVFDRKRALTADYVGRVTERGFKGRLVRRDRKPRDHKAHLSLVLDPPAKENPYPKPVIAHAPCHNGHLPMSDLPFSPDHDWDFKDISHPHEDNAFDPATPYSKDTYRPGLLERPSRKTRQGSTSEEYMRQWAHDSWPGYLERIVRSEDQRSTVCETCHVGDAGWRCLDCLGSPRLCSDCCRIGHRVSPFHKVETWRDGHWQPAWLWQAGTVVCLGHGQHPCPMYESTLDALEARLISVNKPDIANDNSFSAKPKKRTIGCGDVVCFLHTNGFHYLPVYPCWCPDALEDDVQYLDRSFYPATSKSVQTAFTFPLMNQFNLFKIHGHLSAEMYLEILSRLTNEAFPSRAPDRQETLARVWAQWNYLSALKQNGFSRAAAGTTPDKGALALFCPACPQPGINLPPVMEGGCPNVRTVWLYRRYLVVDGNFVLDHMAVRDEGTRLLNGAAYMTEPSRYAKHVAVTNERNEPSTCAKLRAVSERDVFKKGYDVTGVVSVACARHGCFAPGGTVDLQKGEKQLCVDYAVVESYILTRALDTPGGLLAYDVNCQYCIRFRKRIKKGPYLSLSRAFPIDFVIGLFHVHGHKDECLARFAPTYFPGSGATSGEILESLWSQLNPAGRTTRHMNLGRRADSIDACMYYNNLRKLEGLPVLLPKQLSIAQAELKEAEVHLQHVKDSTEQAERSKWDAEFDKAISNRKGNHSSMDILLVKIPPVVTMRVLKADLINDETKNRKAKQGVAAWVASGIEIQMAQIEHRAFLCQNKNPTASESVILAKKRQALAKRVTTFLHEFSALFPSLDQSSSSLQHWANDAIEICVCEGDCLCGAMAELPLAREDVDESSVELSKLPLPSSFNRKPSSFARARTIEEDLRVAQADEALEALRTDIGHKSFLYLENRDWAMGKRERTRSYDRINAVEANMRINIKRYDSARWALDRLGVLSRYPQFLPISRADTKAVSAVYDPNRRGDRNAGMPWIWRRHGSIDEDDRPGGNSNQRSEYLDEIYRVRWLRARCRVDRWMEEVTFIESEMSWYVNYMNFKEEESATRATGAGKVGTSEGALELRQADVWRRRGLEAKEKFGWNKVKKVKQEPADTFVLPLPDSDDESPNVS
ncbi:hypothetical protein NMY22_g7406 [Coprinellus aureogranulatus]|nr:hypothetical protein NMY22_g7406 [Coprinellus aureogranulatus]